jgi:hypothetical protein
LTTSKTFVPVPGVLVRRSGGQFLLAIPESDAVHVLTVSGTAVWTLLDGERTTEQVIEALAEAFQAPARVVTKDVEALLEDLDRRGLIREADHVRA